MGSDNLILGTWDIILERTHISLEYLLIWLLQKQIGYITDLPPNRYMTQVCFIVGRQDYSKK